MSGKKKEYKLDIFRVLNCLMRKDYSFYQSLTQSQQSEIQPLVLMRWLSGTKDENTILRLNQIVNPLVFPLSKHKPLLIQLLTACTSGKVQRAVWNANVKKSSSFPKAYKVIKQYYQYNLQQAVDAFPLHSNQDIIEMAEELGYQSDQISPIKTELKKRREKTTQI